MPSLGSFRSALPHSLHFLLALLTSWVLALFFFLPLILRLLCTVEIDGPCGCISCVDINPGCPGGHLDLVSHLSCADNMLFYL